jgi:hypothetical protein
VRALASLAALLLLGGCFGGSPSPSASATAEVPSAQASGSVPEVSASAEASAPAPSGGKLTQGTYARVIVDGLRVRISAKADATAVGALFFGDVVRIRATAGTSGGFTWYQVESVQTANDQPLLGYVAGAKGATAYLEAMAGPPPPTPPHTPTPSPAPSASAVAS